MVEIMRVWKRIGTFGYSSRIVMYPEESNKRVIIGGGKTPFIYHV